MTSMPSNVNQCIVRLERCAGYLSCNSTGTGDRAYGKNLAARMLMYWSELKCFEMTDNGGTAVKENAPQTSTEAFLVPLLHCAGFPSLISQNTLPVHLGPSTIHCFLSKKNTLVQSVDDANYSLTHASLARLCASVMNGFFAGRLNMIVGIRSNSRLTVW